MTVVVSLIVSYLLGAVPFGLLVAGMRGVNLRSQGSGNIGATNVFRCVGKGWGIFTFTLDALKGFIPAFLFPIIGNIDPAMRSEFGVLYGVAAILGHSFPIYLKFKGGKGVATSAGMLLGIAWQAVAVGFAAWVVCMVVSRYVSLSSMVAAIVVSLASWLHPQYPIVVKAALTALALLVIWLHRANIKRLLNGTESRFGRKKGEQA
jgi:glycerol-3-phosphate acyltransferase PlsY